MKPTYEELARQVGDLQTEVGTLRRANQKYRQTEQMLAKAFHNCPIWVVLSTFEDGRYVEVNETFLKDTGFERDEVIGRTAVELGIWDDPADRAKIIAAIENRGSVQNIAVLRRSKQGRPIHMLFFAERIEIEGQAHLLSTSIDISAREAAEDALRKAKENLEATVRERSAELAATNRQLRREIEQRKQAETVLLESERHYRYLVDNSLVGIFTSAPDGRMLYANQALATMFGYESTDEFMADGVINRYRDPADRRRLIAKLAAAGKVDNYEVDLVDRHGRAVTAILCATLEKDQISGVLTNITHRKAIETALHESEERYRLLLESNPDAVFCHREGIIILANPAAAELFGASAPEELIGRDFYRLVHADDAARLKRRRDQVAQAGCAVPLTTAKFLQINGAEVDVEVGGALVFLDKAPAVQTVARDISARVKADAALRETENRLRLLTNHLPHAMVYQLMIRPDSTRSFLHVSDTVRQIHGLSPYEVMADPKLLYQQVLPAYVDELQAREDKALRTLSTFRCELQCRLPSGEVRWFELVSTPRKRPDGAIVFDGIDIDITARKQAQQALGDSERRLIDIIEFLPDPTWVIDTNGGVIAWNKAVERLTGVKKEDILGKSGYTHAIPFYGEPRPTLVNLLLHRDRKWEDKYLNLTEENGLLVAGDSFHPLLGEDGCYLSATAARLYDTQGNVVGAIQSVRDITAAKQAENERERLIADLKKALAEVRTLSGLLPICANCKKIRDDRGYWNQIELYIRERTDADFSHGVCPDCAQELYPDLDIDIDRGRRKRN